MIFVILPLQGLPRGLPVPSPTGVRHGVDAVFQRNMLMSMTGFGKGIAEAGTKK